MRRLAVIPIVIAALALAAAASPIQAQTTFKIPFKFESGGKKLAAGDYVVTKTTENQIVFKQISTGKETVLPFSQKLTPGEVAATGPRLVFDEVGTFEPSYTEYFSVYVLAEVWLSAEDGYLIHTTKGAHKSQVVKGEAKRE